MHTRDVLARKQVDMETELFLALAEISGVFVGFGALISVRSPEQEDPHSVVYLRAVMVLGVWVLAAALLPVALSRYGVEGRALWQPSAFAVLAIYIVVVVATNLTADYKSFNHTADEAVDLPGRRVAPAPSHRGMPAPHRTRQAPGCSRGALPHIAHHGGGLRRVHAPHAGVQPEAAG